ncbi:MAG: leucine-rich repeat protein [Clostridium sp.]|nr:leucine-rich repeat protein [Clostridium sp.]
MKSNCLKKLLYTVCMVIMGGIMVGQTSMAESADGYTYQVLSDGTAKLVSYDGSNPDKIPDTIAGYPVSVLGERLYFARPLKDNTIPATVRTIEAFAFGYAEDKNIVMPATVTKCGSSIFFNAKIESVTFEEGWTEIPEDMFSGCDELTTVKLPESLLYIRESAFTHGGTIKELVLPAGLIKIEGYAFYATRIEKLVAACPNVELDKDAFWTCSVGELHCYYDSAIYKKYKDSENTKIVFLDDPLFFESAKVTLGAGAEKTLKLIGGNQNVKWKSSNKKIATVNKKGVVTAKKTGTATVTASRDGKKAVCKIKVKKNERKLKSYPTSASAYAVNQAALGFQKIKRDSKGNYVISGHLINTFATATSYAKNLVIKVYQDDKLIAKQTYKMWNIRVPAGSSKAITLTINKKNIKKKKTDLRSGDVRVEVAGGRIY